MASIAGAEHAACDVQLLTARAFRSSASAPHDDIYLPSTAAYRVLDTAKGGSGRTHSPVEATRNAIQQRI